MEPLIVLLVVSTLLFAIGRAGWRPLRPWVAALRGGLAAMFTFTGVSHFGAFGMRDDLVAIVPPGLPMPELLVTVTGVLELAGAVGLLVPLVRQWAAVGLSALLLAIFPANVFKAMDDTTLRFSQQLGPRTALQVVFLAATVAVVVQQARAHRVNATR
jgi:uncharacterized membrane protein